MKKNERKNYIQQTEREWAVNVYMMNTSIFDWAVGKLRTLQLAYILAVCIKYDLLTCN